DQYDPDRLWIGSLFGLLSFDIPSRTFTLHRCTEQNVCNPEAYNGFEDKVRFMCQAGTKIWTASYGGGLTQFDPGTGQFETYKFDRVLPATTSHNNLKRIHLVDDSTLLLLPFNHPLMIFKIHQRQFVTVATANAYMSYQDATGSIWVGQEPGSLLLYRPDAQFIRKVELPQDIGAVFHQPGTDNVYAGSWEGGLYVVNEATWATYYVTYEPAVNTGFNRFRDIHFPRAGNPVLMEEFDIYTFDPSRRRIERLVGPSRTEQGFLSGLWTDDQTLWLGGKDSGLHCVDMAAGNERVLTRDDGLVHDAWISDLCLDTDGHIWYATELGFGAVDHLGKPVYNYRFHPDTSAGASVSPREITAIDHDLHGRIWVSDPSHGVTVLSLEDGRHRVVQRIHTTTGLASNHIRSMVMDSRGDIWVSTDQGMSRIYADGFQVENYG
ncbi:MAG: two-component regulator propeller domain-containing protein, partial [Saprospiraceae bacterium]|nr:two-component regulator propeller domain-containing protein [Saprospiraceae bacterium]